jgi:hypothetical protein
MFTPISGSATIGSAEHSIIGNTTAGVPLASSIATKARVNLDLATLVAGDEFEFRIYTRVNGGTQRLLEAFPFSGTQRAFESPEFWLRDGWDLTLIKTAGTDRIIAWDVISDLGVLATTLEGTTTVARGLRGILRQLLAKRSGYGTTTVTVRDMADTKTSHVIVQDDATDPTAWNSVTLTDLD